MSNAITRTIPKISTSFPRIGGIALGRPRLFPLLAFIAVLLVVSLFFVWSRIQVVHLEYDISSREGRVRDLNQEIRRYQLEVASLRTPARIEGVARDRIGLQLPTPAQVINVDR